MSTSTGWKRIPASIALLLLCAAFLGAAQHGAATAASADAHFEQVAVLLELSDEQREALKEPFRKALEAQRELQRQHARINALLTDDQRRRLAELRHGHAAGGPSGPSGHGAHGAHTDRPHAPPHPHR